MQKSPKQVIDDIRSLYSVGESSRSINHYRKVLRNALDRLSHDLYSKKTHFVLELIQNADDNSYGTRVTPQLVFSLTEKSILVLNNEKGFEEKHVRSLCDVGSSTKSRTYGYIGEKGIGFKSVFKITDEPQVFSNGYRFKFSVTDPSESLGFVVPHWIDELPRFAPDSLTSILLPLRGNADDIWGYFEDLDPHLLLFLNKLKAIEVRYKNGQQKRRIRREEVSHRRVALHTDIVTEGSRPKSTKKNFVIVSLETKKPSDLAEPTRESIKSTELMLAFPLTANGTPAVGTDNYLFAFLPVRQFGFRFIIQADFLVPANREDIHRNSRWNTWLRDSLPTAFCEALAAFKTDTFLRHTFYSFLPRDGEVSDEFFSPVVDELYIRLRQLPCVHTESGKWEQPSRVLFADQSIRELISNQEVGNMVGREYAHHEIRRADLPARLETERFTFGHLIDCLKDSEWVSAKPNPWFTRLFVYLAEQAPDVDSLAALRKVRIIPLANGSFASVDEGAIFLPPDSKGRYEFERDLRILRNGVLPANETVRKKMLGFLKSLGIEEFAAQSVIDAHIKPLYESAGWKDKSPEVLQSHVCFIKDNLDIYVAGIKAPEKTQALRQLETSLYILSSSTNAEGAHVYLRATQLYLPNAYGSPFDLESLFSGIGSVFFVSDQYIEGELKNPSDKAVEVAKTSWKSFFTRLGVNQAPRVMEVDRFEQWSRRRLSSYTDYTVSPEFRELLASDERIERVLTVLDGAWSHTYKGKTRRRSQYGLSTTPSAFLADLQQLEVPTLDGSRTPLSKCILSSATVRNVFGSAVPVLTVSLSNSDMIGEVGIAAKPTLSFAIEQLKHLKDTSRHDIDLAEKLYTYIDRRFDESPSEVKAAFDSGSLILAGTDGNNRFHSLEEVCWRDFGKKVALIRAPLSKNYPLLKEFFIGKLNVNESPTIGDLGIVLQQLSDQPILDDAEVKTVIAIYHDLDRHISSLDGGVCPEWLTTLLGKGIFWTSKSEFWKNDNDIFVNDDKQIGGLFADSSSIAFLAVPEEDIPDLAAFTALAGIKPISQTVGRGQVKTGTRSSQPELSSFLRALLRRIARYLRPKMNNVYRRAREEGLFESLSQVNCWFVDRLVVEYVLRNETRRSERRSALDGTNLYVEAACSEKGDAIAQEYAKHLLGGDSLADFVALLVEKGDIAAVDALLDSRGILSLPADDESYFDELSSTGTSGAKPLGKGILGNESGQDDVSTSGEPPIEAVTEPAANTSVESERIVPPSTGWISEARATDAANASPEPFTPRERVSAPPPDEGAHIRIGDSGRTAERAQAPGAVNEHSFEIGRWGEEWVARTHLKQEYVGLYGSQSFEESESGFKIRNAKCIIEVIWLNAVVEQHRPFDILVREGEAYRYIEVKSSMTDTLEWFDISGNEWDLAVAEGEKFFIYRVYKAGSSQPRLKVIDNPALRWLNHELEANPIRIKF